MGALFRWFLKPLQNEAGYLQFLIPAALTALGIGSNLLGKKKQQGATSQTTPQFPSYTAPGFRAGGALLGETAFPLMNELLGNYGELLAGSRTYPQGAPRLFTEPLATGIAQGMGALGEGVRHLPSGSAGGLLDFDQDRLLRQLLAQMRQGLPDLIAKTVDSPLPKSLLSLIPNVTAREIQQPGETGLESATSMLKFLPFILKAFGVGA